VLPVDLRINLPAAILEQSDDNLKEELDEIPLKRELKSI